jgi:hypothetical protein
VILDHLNQVWTSLLDFLSKLIIPDWGSLIGLLPLLLVLGVIGPLVSILALYLFVYFVRAPRAQVAFDDEGPQPARLDEDGKPIFPTGEPYCLIDGLIDPFGATRCINEGHPLVVRCPKCGLGRPASVGTCGNCGLVLKVEKRRRALMRAAPPPGGAAAA